MTTTEDHFNLFVDECHKWIKFFGLLGWKVCFIHSKVVKDCRANIYFPNDKADRVVTISLSKDWGSFDCTEEDIRKSAFHEVCELLLFRLNDLAFSRFVSRGEIEEEVHSIIRTLENTVFK